MLTNSQKVHFSWLLGDKLLSGNPKPLIPIETVYGTTALCDVVVFMHG